MVSRSSRAYAARLFAIGAGLSLSLLSPALHAEPRVVAPSTAELAVKLFEEGLAIFDAGDRERALDYFLRSHTLSPSKGNTANAAHCLHALGRYDEALELYEELVARFAAELSPENRQRLVPAMASLRGRIGSLEISANVEGSLLVDGRPRGHLPAAGPVRVLGGLRLIRVLKDGYAPFERRVEVKVGETVHLDAVLRPLAQAGQLRLEDTENLGAEVFVDGVRVGTLPWEGTLGPGDHLVWAASAERGSAPTRATVVQGQTAILLLRSSRLGPVESFAVEPASAELRLDGVSLGKGAWSGRLPRGGHELMASEPGYLARTMAIMEGGPEGKPARVLFKLDLDPTHPRWPKRPPVQVELTLFGGFALGPTLHSDAESWCAGSCGAGQWVRGGLAGARAGFRLPFGLSLELTGGYLDVSSSFHRSRPWSFPAGAEEVPILYQLDDAPRVRGGFIAGGVGYRIPLGGRLAMVPRAMIGVLLGGVRDPLSGTVEAAGTSAPVTLGNRRELLATPLLIEPELRLEARFGNVQLGAGLGALFFVTRGPAFDADYLAANPTGCGHAQPTVAACATAKALPAERAFRPFALAVPAVSVGYVF